MNFGGQQAQGGQGGGVGWGAVAQYATAELDREKQDRAALFQNLKGAMSDNEWLMQHFPNFYSTPQVTQSAIANAAPNAPSQSAAGVGQAINQGQSVQNESMVSRASSNKSNAEAEYYRWIMEKNKGSGSSSGGYSSLWS